MPSDVNLSFFLPNLPVGIPSGRSGNQGVVLVVVGAVDWLAWINSRNSDTWSLPANLLALRLADK